MKEEFEAVSSYLIEVDPCRRSSRVTGQNYDTLSIDFKAGRGFSDTKRFCDQVGTALKILEGATQWANLVELCIGLLKEAVRNIWENKTIKLFFGDIQ